MTEDAKETFEECPVGCQGVCNTCSVFIKHDLYVTHNIDRLHTLTCAEIVPVRRVNIKQGDVVLWADKLMLVVEADGKVSSDVEMVCLTDRKTLHEKTNFMFYYKVKRATYYMMNEECTDIIGRELVFNAKIGK